MNRREQLWVLRRCGRKGHQLAWLSDPVAVQFEGTSDTDQQLLRCLRCGTFLPLDVTSVTATYGQADAPVSLADVPLVLRGAHGRKLALLKILAIERGLRALGLFAAAVIVFALGANRDTVIAKTDALITSAGPLAEQIGWNISHSHTLEMLHKGLGSSPLAYNLVGAALVLYGFVQLVEAYGLWGGWRWAEYLAAIATSVFLPLEIYEIVNHPTVLKAIAITVNVAIVIYIIFKGRLFGVRGGHPRYIAEIQEATLLGEVLTDADRSPSEQTSEELV